ncbi:hypothetical protein L2E82_20776 [Cichorium intybus]|uniref:Uncharacterized protein n=1 Tax=Cichorium intybus TaxID=13427 RepID=A0ACB9DU94_CICIN|nr:hypothetical protein L2E82_20776 [Cichorium intybus]
MRIQITKESKKHLQQWDSLTAKFAGGANVPFMLLQLPQIVLNARNLIAGNNSALFAVPWLVSIPAISSSSCLLFRSVHRRIQMLPGNVYCTSRKPFAAIIICKEKGNRGGGGSDLGSCINIRRHNSARHGWMSAATSGVVACGLLINFLYFFKLLNHRIWNLWEDFITVAGLSTLPQVMWSTFVPYVPNNILPGILSFVISVVAVIMARIGKLPEKATKFLGSVSGWTATLLFMWMPVAQMWTNLLSPNNIRGLSAFSMLLAMTGNGLLIPRALFVKDLMWFTGSCWASIFYGWGNLICMYFCASIIKEFFLVATVGLFLWIGLHFKSFLWMCLKYFNSQGGDDFEETRDQFLTVNKELIWNMNATSNVIGWNLQGGVVALGWTREGKIRTSCLP